MENTSFTGAASGSMGASGVTRSAEINSILSSMDDATDAGADQGTGESQDQVDEQGTEDQTEGGEGAADATDAGEDAGADADHGEEAGEAEEGEAAEQEEPASEEAAATEQSDADEVRERNGKKEYVLKESRYQTVYGGYKAAQAAEQVFGEPLTQEAAEARQNAFVDRERLLSDYFSGDEQGETAVLEYLAGAAQKARDSGEVGHDPLANIAARLPQFLLQRNPDAYQKLEVPIARNLLDALYRHAIETEQDDVLLAVQHVDNVVFQTYKKKEQLAAPSSLDAREQQLQQREQRLNTFEQRQRENDWKAWHASASEQISSAVTSAIDGVLKPVEQHYKDFPRHFENLRASLNKHLQDSLRGDAAWQVLRNNLVRRAQNATSPEVRAAVAKELVAKYNAKAAYILDPLRSEPVKAIFAEATKLVKADSASRHARLERSAARREPGTGGAPVSQTVKVPEPKSFKSQAEWRKYVASLPD